MSLCELQKSTVPHFVLFEEVLYGQVLDRSLVTVISAALVGFGAIVAPYSRQIRAAHQRLKSLGS